MLCPTCGSTDAVPPVCSMCGTPLNAPAYPPPGGPFMQAAYPGYAPSPMYAPYGTGFQQQALYVPDVPPNPAPPGEYILQGVVATPPTNIEMLAPFDYAQLISVPIRIAVRTITSFIFLTTMFLFSPFIIIFYRTGRSSAFKPRDRIPYMKLRILQANGEQREVLIPVDDRGPGISWGDYVSLQGKEQRGVIVVSGGYNHMLQRPLRVRSLFMYKVQLVWNIFLIIAVIFLLARWGVFTALWNAITHH